MATSTAICFFMSDLPGNCYGTSLPVNMGEMVTGAQAVVDCLRRERVEHVFGIPGTMNLPILDVLRDTPEMRFILTRHEQGAAFMAYGYARALNRPGIVTATEGPGVTNLATGIGAAYKGYVPVISISGAQELCCARRTRARTSTR